MLKSLASEAIGSLMALALGLGAVVILIVLAFTRQRQHEADWEWLEKLSSPPEPPRCWFVIGPDELTIRTQRADFQVRLTRRERYASMYRIGAN